MSLVLLSCAKAGSEVANQPVSSVSDAPDAPVVEDSHTTTTPPDGRATALRDLAAADPSSPALIVTPGLDVPNPIVIVEDGRFLMYSSQTSFFPPSVALRESDSLFEWPESAVDVLPNLPDWASVGHTWAPDARRIGDRFVLYITARVKDFSPSTQCIGVASADNHAGPFEPEPDPLVCQLDRKGSIDPRTFLDADGDLWLHWKSDDNADIEGTSTSTIYAQRLSADGMKLVGEPTRILEVDQPWEGRIIEAPQMTTLEDQYWLFYSGNWFNQPAYAIGAARCEGPAGPCTKPFDAPLISSNAQGEGPGEASFVEDPTGRLWIAYSPWAVEFETPTARPVAIARVELDDQGPYLAEFDPAALGEGS